MDKLLDEKLRELEKIKPFLKNEELIRNLSCEIAAIAADERREEAVLACLKKIRSLENERCLKSKSCKMQSVDIGKLFENIALAADVILSSFGKNFSFTFESGEVVCNSKLIVDAFLNLISNSAKFGKGNTVSARLYSSNDFEYISVENEGAIDFSDFCASKGLKACSNAARLHSGRLLLSSSKSTSSAVFSFYRGFCSFEKYEIPSFSEFLSDSFSILKVGLCDLKESEIDFL